MFKFSRQKRLYCSFCRKPEKQVAKLIAGPGVYICDACVGLCNDILGNRPTPGFAGWDSLSDDQLLAALPPSETMVDSTRAVLQTQVEVLRQRGISWAAIGEALGISRQAAWERFS
ncbi:hypothetical protein FQU96_19915 [Reyranella sp. CPCC 100927]|nr:hypothetical protein FQU96_19915 [Reyranella sp. CPCC 100927]